MLCTLPGGLACFPQNIQTIVTEFQNIPLHSLLGLQLFLQLAVSTVDMELRTCCFFTTPARWFLMEVGARHSSARGHSGPCLVPHAPQVFAQQGRAEGAGSWPFLLQFLHLPQCPIALIVRGCLPGAQHRSWPGRGGVRSLLRCLPRACGVAGSGQASSTQSSSLVAGLACLPLPASGSLLPTPSGLHSPCVAVAECPASRSPQQELCLPSAASRGWTDREDERTPSVRHDHRRASPDCFPLLFEAELLEARVSGLAHF